MNSIQKRFLLFLFGCIVSRLVLVYIAKTIPLNYLPILGIITLGISFGFAYIYFNNLRKSGPETLGDKIWWNNIRPVHSLLYLLFSCNALLKIRSGWIYLLIDVVFGLISFLIYHYTNGDFRKLI